MCLLQVALSMEKCLLNFIERHLIPHPHPFNGINLNSVVIMDNCTIHHVPEICEIIEDVGAMVHFLPPYSPDFNPIELAFSKVKTTMQALEESTRLSCLLHLHQLLSKTHSHGFHTVDTDNLTTIMT